MKRMIAILLSVLVLTGVFAACSGTMTNGRGYDYGNVSTTPNGRVNGDNNAYEYDYGYGYNYGGAQNGGNRSGSSHSTDRSRRDTNGRTGTYSGTGDPQNGMGSNNSGSGMIGGR